MGSDRRTKADLRLALADTKARAEEWERCHDIEARNSKLARGVIEDLETRGKTACKMVGSCYDAIMGGKTDPGDKKTTEAFRLLILGALKGAQEHWAPGSSSEERSDE